mgnify:CR=1 FL=1
MNTYKTSDVARIFGIHVNTVRLYETYGLIPKPERRSNGYRIFTDIHIEQFSLARAALQVEVLQNGLRKLAVDIIKVAASGDYDEAAELARRYIAKVDVERENAEEAIEITRNILLGIAGSDGAGKLSFSRKEASEFLNVTVDTLRNWELNGLVTVTVFALCKLLTFIYFENAPGSFR